MGSPAAQLPVQPDQAAVAPDGVGEKAAEAAQPEVGAKVTQLLAEPATTLPSIAEEEPTRALNPAEGVPLES